MTRSKTLDIMVSFSPEELKAASAFVKSPYFNTNKNLVKLYEVIKKQLMAGKKGEITEESIFKKVFPGKPHNYGIMKNLSSSLFSLLEQFLIFNTIKDSGEKKFHNTLTLAAQYDSRFLDSYFKRIMNKLRNEMSNGLIYPGYYRDFATLEEHEYFFHSSRTDDNSLQNAVYNEAIYSIADFFRKFSRSLWKLEIIEGNVNSKFDIDLKKIIATNINFEAIAESLKGIDQKTYVNIKMNSLLIKLLTDGTNVEHYSNIMALLVEKIDMFDNYERFSIISKIVSYCAVMYENGRTEFLPESLNVQKLMMEKVRFKSNGLGPYNFHNYVELAQKFIYENRTEEAEALVKNNLHWLEDDKQDLARRLVTAAILVEHGENEKAIEQIKTIKLHDTFVKMLVRKIYIKAYYELGNYEQGFDIIASFKTFVREKSDLDAYSKSTNLGSLKIFEKLFKMKCSPEKYSADDVNLLEKMISENNYVNRKWQLEKTQELKEIMTS